MERKSKQAQEKIKKWTESDIQKLIDALEEIPDFLLTPNLKGFYRFSKSKHYPNPAVSAEDVIALYDTAFKSSKNLGQILTHELAHINYKELKQKNQLDYGHATGWRYNIENDNKLYLEGRKSGYIAEDGRTSVEEDYANNLEHFLYSPDKLKKVTPEAYNWFNKTYKDLKLKERKK